MKRLSLVLILSFLFFTINCQIHCKLETIIPLSNQIRIKDSIYLLNKVKLFKSLNNKEEIRLSISYFTDISCYQKIKNYSNELIPILTEHYHEIPNCCDLLALLILPKVLNDSLIKFKNISLRAKARLGNYEAQEYFVKKFQESLQMHPFEENLFFYSLEQLFYINSTLTKKIISQEIQSNAIIQTTCETIEDNPDLYYSMTYLILSKYREMYMEEPLFNIKYMNNFLFVESEQDFDNYHKQYFKEIEDFYFEKELLSLF